MFPGSPLGVLSGPNLSREVVSGKPAISLIASRDKDLVHEYQHLLSTERFRVYGSTDVTGTELGGSLKNIMAIAAGISDGLDLGQNAMAALITRGIAEMIRLGEHLGAEAKTFYGVSGLGDLVCTSQSRLSRNHEVGRRLASGETLGEILGSTKSVAEGVGTTKHVHEYAVEHGIDLPITGSVFKILYESADPGLALRELMTRKLKME
jgi:glycerol-3-phosphate dehydrogenase (NAD(P)+)